MKKLLAVLVFLSFLCGTVQAALPVTITDIDFLATSSQGRARPYISSGGNVYFFAKDGGTTTQLNAFKATDPTDSFSQAATLAITNSGVLLGIGTFQDGDNIHIATQDDNDVILYHLFSMSSDTFTTSNESVTSAVGTDLDADKAISISLETGGDVILFYQGASENSGGQKERVDLAHRVVSTWTVDQAVDAGGSVHYYLGGIVRGEANKFHLTFKDDTNIEAKHRSVQDVDGTLSAVEDLSDTDTDALNFVVIQPVYYDTGGVERITATWQRQITQAFHTSEINDDGTPVAEENASQFSVLATSEFIVGSYAVDEKTVWSIHVSVGTPTIYSNNNVDSAGWSGTDNSEVAGADPTLLTSNIYQRGTDIVLAFIYEDTGTVKYNETVLRSVSSGASQGSRGARTGFIF